MIRGDDLSSIGKGGTLNKNSFWLLNDPPVNIFSSMERKPK